MYRAANNDNIYNSYECAIDEQLKKDPSNFNFLDDPRIGGVFGVSVEIATLYDEQILNEFKENSIDMNSLDKFNLFGGNNNIIFSKAFQRNVSSNTLRYIYHALLLDKYLTEKYGNGKIRIIEIGGGYGGLAYWLNSIRGDKILNYDIYDLQNASKLQKVSLDYLTHSNLYRFFSSPLDFKDNEFPSTPIFCVSNYAFSELNAHYQKLYAGNIIKKVDSGFILWNNLTGICIFTDKPLRMEIERPCTQKGNTFIYF
jgi:hypothetical protein